MQRGYRFLTVPPAATPSALMPCAQTGSAAAFCRTVAARANGIGATWRRLGLRSPVRLDG